MIRPEAMTNIFSFHEYYCIYMKWEIAVFIFDESVLYRGESTTTIVHHRRLSLVGLWEDTYQDLYAVKKQGYEVNLSS